MLPDKISRLFADSGAMLSVQILEDDVVLIEGNSEGLLYLSNLLITIGCRDEMDGYQILPDGAGASFFSKGSTHGIYISKKSSFNPE